LSNEKVWTKDFILLLFIMLFGTFAFFGLMGGLPLHVDQRGWTTTATGVMTFGHGIGAILAA
jgi:hypothetical protein